MDEIIEIRVDDRLIHGQVAGLWTNALQATRLMVIDDAVSQNETQKSLLRMVAPGSVNTSIISEEKAFLNISAGKYVGQRVFVIVKSPVVILNLLKRGLPIKRINIGNISARDDTKVLKSGISVTLTEEKALKEILDAGVQITTIRTPTDPEAFLTKKDLKEKS
ncbi:PTS sugar transporter subunit IIB [Sporolactobacillus shoreicorticis]|uniref:PTS sugar transporter subunit IIB n=1 Tax=Sporolactobacillus shoreicorticis TaxID=1923877 RepID=A0ABW5S3Q7_9BACL|nr:PTS sugar transporter subunit IIB [Sporolactobacillus shoreicorticis]MCO7124688.1 PTS sugar transporter subunit IIB [Sporolactobacillus shoreicorticis]